MHILLTIDVMDGKTDVHLAAFAGHLPCARWPTGQQNYGSSLFIIPFQCIDCSLQALRRSHAQPLHNWLNSSPPAYRLQAARTDLQDTQHFHTYHTSAATSELRKLLTISILPPCRYRTNQQPGLILPTDLLLLDLLSGIL